MTDLLTQYICTDTTFKSLPYSTVDMTQAMAFFHQDVTILFATILSVVVLGRVGIVLFISSQQKAGPYSKTQSWYQLEDILWSNSVPIIPDSGSCTVTLFLISLRVWLWSLMRWKSIRIHLQKGHAKSCGDYRISQSLFYERLAFDPDNSSLRRLQAFHLCFCTVF